MRLRALVLLFVPIASLWAACASDRDPSTCVPGATVECPCGNGVRGAQTCKGDGTYESCRCAEIVETPDTATDVGLPDAVVPIDSSSETTDAVLDSADGADSSDTAPTDTTPDTALTDTTPDASETDAVVVCPSAGGCVLRVWLPVKNGTFMTGFVSVNYSICPGGAKPTASPPQCILEIDLATPSWTTGTDGGSMLADAALPMRVQKLPITLSVVGPTEWIVGNDTCASPTAAPVATRVAFTGAAPTSRLGCEPATVATTSYSRTALTTATSPCSTGLLSDTVVAAMKEIIADEVIAKADEALKAAAASATCRGM